MPSLIQTDWNLDFQALSEFAARQDHLKPVFSEGQVAQWQGFLKHLGASEKVQGHAKKIGETGSQVIITGQQIGVGINPSLILQKLFTIEVLAKEVSAASRVDVLPIFWLQTEDHDLSEISNVVVSSQDLVSKSINLKDEILRFNSKTEEKTSVGRLKCGKLLEVLKPELEVLFPELEESEVFQKFSRSYVKENSLTEAFGKFFYSLFPESEICFFDINLPGFDNLKTEIFSKALNGTLEIGKILEKNAEELKLQGLDTQVSVRKSSPLFFYHPEGKDNSRYRLELVQDALVLKEKNHTYSRNEIQTEILNNPTSFSTSALLRPILQDKIFNTVAYVGGKAEISYLKQISPLYPYFDVLEPLRILRPSGVILDDKSIGHVNDFSISSNLLLSNQDEIKRSILDAIVPPEKRVGNILRSLNDNIIFNLEEILTEAEKLDSTLRKPKEKTLISIKRSLNKFFQKYELAQLTSNAVISKRVDRIIKQLFPNGAIQERSLSLLSLGLCYGDDVFEQLKNSYLKWFREFIKKN